MAKKKKSFSWKRQVLLIFLLIAAAIFLPTTVILGIGMLPSIVALLIDKTSKRTKSFTVASINLAGCTPFMMELWMKGHNFENSFNIITDPMAIIVMYAAAAIGYMIDWALTGIIAGILYERGKARLNSIKKEQDEMIQRWGREVTGDIPLDPEGFALEGSDIKDDIDEMKASGKEAAG